MDEMSMVRRLLEEPAPGPQVVAKGRERLFGSPRRVVRTRRVRRAAVRSALGLGVTGALAATALLVATLVPEGTPPRGARPPTAEGSARSVLLAAAERAESEPTSGTYWHSRSMSRSTLSRELGRGENRYTVEVLSVREHWTSRDGQDWWGVRQWVRPESAEDEAAWRRDGSPSKWCNGTTDTEPPEPKCLYAAPGTARLDHMGENSFDVYENADLTFEQLQRLPTDPAELRAWVVEAMKDGLDLDDLDPSDAESILNQNVAGVLDNLLVGFPAPPDVRAAAFGVLADMPNVESLGPTRDELGRAGVGIRIVFDGGIIAWPGLERFEPGEAALTLIIDPDTSLVLATALGATGSDPLGGTLILEAGWTDEKPHKPEMP